MRAGPPSVRRSPDGAKPQGRTPHAGFQPGLKFSLVKRKKVYFCNDNPFGLSHFAIFAALRGGIFFMKTYNIFSVFLFVFEILWANDGQIP